MKRHLFLIAFLAIVSPLAAAAQSNAEDNEQIAVRQVIENYLLKKDPEAVKRALFADTQIIEVIRDEKVGREKVVVKKLFGTPYKQRQKDETVILPEQRIVAIDITESGASVKVESEFSSDLLPPVLPRKHIQYISLLKVNDEWKIVSILMPPLRFAEAASK